MRIFIKLLAVGITLIIAVSACSCETEQLPVPPPPVSTAGDNTSAESDTEEVSIEETEEPVDSTPVTEISINSNTMANHFPDKITFTLQATSDSVIKKIVLDYGSDKRSLATEVNSIEPEFDEGSEIDVSWDWEMKKTGSLPPGATVWWRWELTDENDKITTTERQSMVYVDTRFQWQTSQIDEMDIFWNSQSETLRQELTGELGVKLARIQLDVVIPEERKIKIFVYRDSEELRGALLHEQEWTGAVAFTEYNIILTAVNEDSLDWAKETLPHEITHLLVREVIFGPFGDIPTWLNEGLSVYSEGELSQRDLQSLKTAYEDDELISLQSLASSFPADPWQALLAYAESGSIVTYLIDEYGWESMRQLLQVFKDGSTYDNALQEVYGFDMSGLHIEWEAYLGNNLQAQVTRCFFILVTGGGW